MKNKGSTAFPGNSMAETEYIIYLFLKDDLKPKQTIKLKRSLTIRHCCILQAIIIREETSKLLKNTKP